MIKKVYAIICAISLMAVLPALGMEEHPLQEQCTQCNTNEAKSIGGTAHTTYLLSPLLLSFPLPFQSACHNLCEACEHHIQNINLSPLQKLGCKHCFMQKNPTYAGCSNLRFWSEVALITAVAGVICYSAYKWWKDEDAQEKDKDANSEQEGQKAESAAS